MPTELENLQARRQAIWDELAQLQYGVLGGNPNLGGNNRIDHQGYKRGLYEELERLNGLIRSVEGPWEVIS